MNRAKKMIASIFFTAVIMISLILVLEAQTVYAKGDEDYGTTGDCKWNYYKDEYGRYILNIYCVNKTGGRMEDYTLISGESSSPWAKYRTQVDDVIFTNVTEIGDYAFRAFTKISKVDIQGVKRIGDHAFYACSDLREIHIKGDNCEIQNQAFDECEGNVMNVVELEGVKSVGEDSFGEVDCSQLILGEGLESIGRACFYCNERLYNVTIPKSCKFIDGFAFSGCEKMEWAIVLNPSCTIGEYAFDKDYVKTIYGPKNSTAKVFADQNGITFRAIGDMGTGTLDLSQGQLDLDADKPDENDNIIKNTLGAIIVDGKVGAKEETDYNKLVYIDVDKDGTYDFTLEIMTDTPVHPLRVLQDCSAGGEYTFKLSQTVIDAYASARTPIYGTLTIRLPEEPIGSATVSRIPDQTYTGKEVMPEPTITLNDKDLEPGTHFVFSYHNNKNVGTASVTIYGKGKYTGEITRAFKINPTGTSISKVTGTKKSFTVKWKKQTAKMTARRITGYQIQYSTNKKFKSGIKTVTVKNYKKSSKKITKLKAKKKYYVRIRTYAKIGGKTYNSSWSKPKNVKTK